MGDGNLGAGVLARTAHLTELAFNRARGMQGEQTASILRYTVSGRNAAAMAGGTETLVSGLADLPVLVSDMTRELAESMGEEFQAGTKVIEFHPSSSEQYVLDTDHIRWDGKRWKPTRIDKDTDYSSCVAYCRREE